MVANEELDVWVVIAGGTEPSVLLRVLLLTFVVAGTLGVGDIAQGGGDEARIRGLAVVGVDDAANAPTGAVSLHSMVLVTAANTFGTSCGFDVAPLTIASPTLALKGEGSRTNSRRPPSADGSCLSALPSLLCSPLSRCLGKWCLSGLGGLERFDSVSESEMSSRALISRSRAVGAVIGGTVGQIREWVKRVVGSVDELFP